MTHTDHVPSDLSTGQTKADKTPAKRSRIRNKKAIDPMGAHPPAVSLATISRTVKETLTAKAPPSPSATKQDLILDLLRRADGATLDELCRASNWQRHSLRGFLSGTVRKKLKLTVISALKDGKRVYKILPAEA